MTIKEVEKRTGLTRSNIRFYEKEKLIEPSRNERNGYREYSEKDVETITKIAYLRTLEISIEDIRSIMSEKVSLTEVLEKQNRMLQEQIENLSNAKAMCERMLEAGNVNFDELQVEKYVVDLQNYWSDNKTVFKLDSVGFLYLWGNIVTWAILVSLCLIVSVLSYDKLPPEIPIQWSKGMAISFVDKKYIFVYPLACVVIRILLKPVIYVRLVMHNLYYGEFVTEYLLNYLCFIVLSAEAFSILFIFGVVKNIAAVLITDTIVLIGVLMAGIGKMNWGEYSIRN